MFVTKKRLEKEVKIARQKEKNALIHQIQRKEAMNKALEGELKSILEKSRLQMKVLATIIETGEVSLNREWVDNQKKIVIVKKENDSYKVAAKNEDEFFEEFL